MYYLARGDGHSRVTLGWVPRLFLEKLGEHLAVKFMRRTAVAVAATALLGGGLTVGIGQGVAGLRKDAKPQPSSSGIRRSH